MQEVLPQRLLLDGQLHPLVIEVVPGLGLVAPSLAQQLLGLAQVDLQRGQAALGVVLAHHVELRIQSSRRNRKSNFREPNLADFGVNLNEGDSIPIEENYN